MTLPLGLRGLSLEPYAGPEDDPPPDPPTLVAAVSLILRAVPGGSEILLIRRSPSPTDPWSGHMALPGGRREEDDGSLLETARREAWEETSVDPLRAGDLLGRLPLVAPQSAELPPLKVVPFVFALARPVSPRPREGEVEEVLWASLEGLLRPAATAVHHHSTADGRSLRFPAFDVEGRTVWGMTHRILKELLDRFPSARG